MCGCITIYVSRIFLYYCTEQWQHNTEWQADSSTMAISLCGNRAPWCNVIVRTEHAWLCTLRNRNKYVHIEISRRLINTDTAKRTSVLWVLRSSLIVWWRECDLIWKSCVLASNDFDYFRWQCNNNGCSLFNFSYIDFFTNISYVNYSYFSRN